MTEDVKEYHDSVKAEAVESTYERYQRLQREERNIGQVHMLSNKLFADAFGPFDMEAAIREAEVNMDIDASISASVSNDGIDNGVDRNHGAEVSEEVAAERSKYFMALQLINIAFEKRSFQSTLKIVDALKTSKLGRFLEHTSLADLKLLSDACVVRSLKRKDILETESGVIVYVYIILHGSIEATRNSSGKSVDNDSTEAVSSIIYHAGEYLGSSINEENYYWDSTLTASSDASVCVIPVESMRQLVGINNSTVQEFSRYFLKFTRLHVHLRNHPRPLVEPEISIFATRIRPEIVDLTPTTYLHTYSAGRVIFEQDSDQSYLYLLYMGEVELFKNGVSLNALYDLYLLPPDFILLEMLSVDAFSARMQQIFVSNTKDMSIFGVHECTMVAKTMVKIVTIPLRELAKSRAVFMGLLSRMNARYPKLLLPYVKIVEELALERAWKECGQGEQLQLVHDDRQRSSLSEKTYVNVASSISCDDYKKKKSGHVRMLSSCLALMKSSQRISTQGPRKQASDTKKESFQGLVPSAPPLSVQPSRRRGSLMASSGKSLFELKYTN